MKHTNGPWHICEVTGKYFRIIRDEKGFAVAEAIYPRNSEARYINMDANAQLISAAPDLLDALIELQQMVEAGESNEGTHEIVRNAIAKATGTQS
jgi:hypothetical protein